MPFGCAFECPKAERAECRNKKQSPVPLLDTKRQGCQTKRNAPALYCQQGLIEIRHDAEDLEVLFQCGTVHVNGRKTSSATSTCPATQRELGARIPQCSAMSEASAVPRRTTLT